MCTHCAETTNKALSSIIPSTYQPMQPVPTQTSTPSGTFYYKKGYNLISVDKIKGYNRYNEY